MEDTEPWYSRQVYARYWRHYDLAMRWMRRHQRAYRKAMESFYHLPWHPYTASPRSRYSDWDGNDLPHTQNYSSSYSPHGRAPYRGGAPCYTDAHQGREDADRDSEMEDNSESEGEIEYDLSNMEITEELRQFFAQTERHREELRRQQQLEAEQEYVDADQDLHRTERTVEPPTERPGERRMAEMRKLYGAEADKIQAMEAALQLIFDRNCDKKQPKYWPIIPLKLNAAALKTSARHCLLFLLHIIYHRGSGPSPPSSSQHHPAAASICVDSYTLFQGLGTHFCIVFKIHVMFGLPVARSSFKHKEVISLEYWRPE